MMHTGLFAAPRPMETMAEHAWTNDLRIQEMTGQRFSEAYRRDVLHAEGGEFCSASLTLALVAVGETDRSLEPLFLSASQTARYTKSV